MWNEQNRDKYGFVALGDLLLPERDKERDNISDIVCLHKLVKNSGSHNFMESQIKVSSQLNYKAWEFYLDGYWNTQLCLLIKYGFPLDFDNNTSLHHGCKSHNSAINHADDVKAYIQEEK